MIEIALAFTLLPILLGFLGWLFSKDGGSNTGSTNITLPEHDDHLEAKQTDSREFKSLEQTFDNRWTNLFRPWGGLFGDD